MKLEELRLRELMRFLKADPLVLMGPGYGDFARRLNIRKKDLNQVVNTAFAKNFLYFVEDSYPYEIDCTDAGLSWAEGGAN